MITNRRPWLVAGAVAALLGGAMPAFAEDLKAAAPCCVDWNKLGLSPQQSQQVQVLEKDWNSKYTHIQPRIVAEQKELVKLLGEPKSDPLEIMETQQQITRLREQLRNEATTNYLRKRALLTASQQHQLEGMLQQMVTDRQQRTSVQASTVSDQNGGIMNIVNKVKWAIEPH